MKNVKNCISVYLNNQKHIFSKENKYINILNYSKIKTERFSNFVIEINYEEIIKDLFKMCIMRYKLYTNYLPSSLKKFSFRFDKINTVHRDLYSINFGSFTLSINNFNNKVKEIKIPTFFFFHKKIKLPFKLKIFSSGLGESYFKKYKINLPPQLKKISMFFHDFSKCTDLLYNNRLITDKQISHNILLTIIYEKYGNYKEICQQKCENNTALFVEKQKLYEKYNSNIILYRKEPLFI